jgi:hypothetical protein
MKPYKTRNSTTDIFVLYKHTLMNSPMHVQCSEIQNANLKYTLLTFPPVLHCWTSTDVLICQMEATS